MNTWPPRVSAQELSDGTCTSALNVFRAMGFALGNLTASYTADVRQDVSAAISTACLLVPEVETGIPWEEIAEKYDFVTRQALRLFDYLLEKVGLHRRDIYNAIAAGIAEIPHVLRCDIKAV